MEKAINKKKDHYIICGMGNHSFHIIDELEITKRQSVYIESEPEVLKYVQERYPEQNYIAGDPTHANVLTKAGIERARGLFATTDDDNINMVVCLLARKMNPQLRIIALCMNHENQFKIKLAGADEVVSPNYMGGLRMASEMLRPVVSHFLDTMLSDAYKNLRIEQITFKADMAGKEISEIRKDELKDVIFIGLKSGDDLIFKPDEGYTIREGDMLLYITTPDERIKLEEKI